MSILQTQQDDQIDFDKVNLADSRYFSALYDFYGPMLWRHALIRTSSADDADEILSKTFLKTWEYVRTRRKVKNIRAFLWTVTNRLLVDFYRSKAVARTRLADFSETENQQPAIMPDLHEKLTLQGEALKVAQALQVLGGNEQIILTLRFMEELPLAEVASACGKSKNATAVAIHRALKRLRQTMNMNAQHEA